MYPSPVLNLTLLFFTKGGIWHDVLRSIVCLFVRNGHEFSCYASQMTRAVVVAVCLFLLQEYLSLLTTTHQHTINTHCDSTCIPLSVRDEASISTTLTWCLFCFVQVHPFLSSSTDLACVCVRGKQITMTIASERQWMRNWKHGTLSATVVDVWEDTSHLITHHPSLISDVIWLSHACFRLWFNRFSPFDQFVCFDSQIRVSNCSAVNTQSVIWIHPDFQSVFVHPDTLERVTAYPDALTSMSVQQVAKLVDWMLSVEILLDHSSVSVRTDSLVIHIRDAMQQVCTTTTHTYFRHRLSS